METGHAIICSAPLFIALAIAWGIVCAWLGWLLHACRTPKRAIFIEDSGAWTIGKFRESNHLDDVPSDIPASVEG